MTKANNYVGDKTGTINYHKYHLSRYQYTDGVKDMVKLCASYWLLTLIISHQNIPRVKNELFQVWDLVRSKGFVIDVIATDGNQRIIASQQLQHCDFPFDSATIWVEGTTLLLPCEH